MLADQAFERFVLMVKAMFDRERRANREGPPLQRPCVCDIGAGTLEHAVLMLQNNFEVSVYDHKAGSSYPPDVQFLPSDRYHGIWCSHTLEHVGDIDLFLGCVFSQLRPGGVFAVTVPPLKPQLVGGHLSLWTAGLLLYRLILAGFDCSEARVGTYGYNISVVLQKSGIDLPLFLARDNGDIDLIAEYFPEGLSVYDGIDGRFPDSRWD